jgi:hypothetical protein
MDALFFAVVPLGSIEAHFCDLESNSVPGNHWALYFILEPWSLQYRVVTYTEAVKDHVGGVDLTL